MEGKEQDVSLGANKFPERQPLGIAAQSQDEPKDYQEPPPAPFFEPSELTSWSFYRAGIAEFVATFLFLYITILTVFGVQRSPTKCQSVGIQGIAWAFGGMIFALVYCTAGISGGHINPAVTFGLFLARKLSLTRAVFYIVMQVLGAIVGAGVVKGFEGKERYAQYHGGANFVNSGYTKGDGLGAEIVGTFVLVYTVFSATDAKRSARDSHVPILAPLPIGFAVFLVHLATIPITGTGINPARSLGAAIIFNKDLAWDDHWIFWVGPFIGAALAALYHQVVIRAIPFKSKRPDQAERVIGTLLGSVLTDGTLDIRNSYAVPHNESIDQVALDIEYHHNMLLSHQKVNPKEVIVGWYSTGLGVTGGSALIHEFYSREVSNPIHLTVDTGFLNGEGTIKAYVSNNLSLGDRQIAAQFQEIPLDLRMVEAERMGFDTLKATAIDKIPSDLEGMETSMQHLLALIDDIYKYVDDVVEGRSDPDNRIGRFISDAVGSLPKLPPSAFDKLVNDSLQDHLLLLYLSSITRTQLSLAEKLNTLAQIL
ncbi:hypothetical protein TanjilG_00653 [Lupinus angustifolius]|uniref:Eukaryotic translation initiation factor 3 subunit F n=2 Tax=Lupinus angustifolius TaxID=3871 RepID=A0A4P1R739_LUPAN|nr:hypothetical protein TanjilG_00653 [Lupinus angustifolius]